MALSLRREQARTIASEFRDELAVSTWRLDVDGSAMATLRLSSNDKSMSPKVQAAKNDSRMVHLPDLARCAEVQGAGRSTQFGGRSAPESRKDGRAVSKWQKVVLSTVAAAVCIVPLSLVLTSTTSLAKSGAKVGTVYEASVACCTTIPVGQWPASSAPVLTTNTIPEGIYTVEANAFLVMQPNDNENCWLSSSNPSDVIEQGGGAAGNGSSTSGTGPGGVYASPTVTATVEVNAPNDTLTLNCDSKAAPPVTSYAAAAFLMATKVAAVNSI